MSEKLKFLKLVPSAMLPTRSSTSSAGLDLHSIEQVELEARARVVVRTGLAVAIPSGAYGRIAPRSGLARQAGIDVLGGVIDSDYRGELICILINHGDESYRIQRGDRIAQLIIERILDLTPEWVTELDYTERSEKGFGSSDR